MSSSLEVRRDVGCCYLDALLAIPPDQFDEQDVGRLSLLCAIGLPGCESFNVAEHLAILNAWANEIRSLTKRCYDTFLRNKSEFLNSEAIWRICGIASYLERDCNVHYCEAEKEMSQPADWQKSDQHMMHGLTGRERHGTCASMPLLMAAVARRLGYPVRLAYSPGHVFCRWDGENHRNKAYQERFNIQFSGGLCFPTDEEFYESPIKWTEQTHEAERLRGNKRLFLRSITPAEEFSFCLNQRSHAYEAHGRFHEAMLAYEQAHRFAPHDDQLIHFSRECHTKYLDTVLRRWGLDARTFLHVTELKLKGWPERFPWEDEYGRLDVTQPSPYDHPQVAKLLLQTRQAVMDRLSGNQKLPPVLQANARPSSIPFADPISRLQPFAMNGLNGPRPQPLQQPAPRPLGPTPTQHQPPLLPPHVLELLPANHPFRTQYTHH